jgi:hypothetical protein
MPAAFSLFRIAAVYWAGPSLKVRDTTPGMVHQSIGVPGGRPPLGVRVLSAGGGLVDVVVVFEVLMSAEVAAEVVLSVVLPNAEVVWLRLSVEI